MSRLRTLRVVSALAILTGASTLAHDLAPRHAASLNFFSTSAQVIPVTLLVLVLQARVFGAADVPWPKDTYGRMNSVLVLIIAVSVVALMLIAEFVALDTLANGNAKSGNCPRVYGGLAIGFAAVCLMLIYKPYAETSED